MELISNYTIKNDLTNNCFEMLKVNKKMKKFKNEIQILVHSIFIIYFLSIFDIVDTYHLACVTNYNTTGILKNNEQSLKSVLALRNLNEDTDKRLNVGNTFLFVEEQEFANFKRIIERKIINEFRNNEDQTNDLLQTTTGSIVVLFRTHSKTFEDILKVCFCFLVMVKLEYLEKIGKSILRNRTKQCRRLLKV